MTRGWTPAFCLLLLASTSPLAGQSLRGSPTSLDRQNDQAVRHDYTYLASTSQVRRFVESGYLVPVDANGDFRLKAVSFPYARPEVKLFVERLAAQYRRACGEPLIVTSLTRPLSRQPRNASDRSVHPTGMAVDLRRSTDPGCRAWLERVLLDLEGKRVLEATRERRPPHYHVAVFPEPYQQYVAQLTGTELGPEAGSQEVGHRVARGESLWAIAQKYGTTLDSIREANGLSGSRIYAGQLLRVPVAR
ncbi:MAG: DUF5715 family protein [Gemmatimonadota bacterium]